MSKHRHPKTEKERIRIEREDREVSYFKEKFGDNEYQEPYFEYKGLKKEKEAYQFIKSLYSTLGDFVLICFFVLFMYLFISIADYIAGIFSLIIAILIASAPYYYGHRFARRANESLNTWEQSLYRRQNLYIHAYKTDPWEYFRHYE